MNELPQNQPSIVYWCEGISCCDPLWEQAYQDFETPEEEIAKFKRRYERLGVDAWDRDSRIVELFCGSGNSLVVLTEMGFDHVEGVDLSPDLLKQYTGPVQTYVGDCRDLKFADGSKDVVIIQGGLHHLPELPDDVDAVLAEVQRILSPGGKLVVIEPWLTPYLRIVHAACAIRPLRFVWPKLDAVARMNEQEAVTYYRWLKSPKMVVDALMQRFTAERQTFGWGKIMFIGKPR